MPPNDQRIAKPLIMGPRSIRAWHQNAKTQTRRLVRPQPEQRGWEVWQNDEGIWEYWYKRYPGAGFGNAPVRQPYAVGDLLWIREALRRLDSRAALGDSLGIIAYAADDSLLAGPNEGFLVWHWKRDKLPAMFCPRWASRYYAKVLAVRPERLQDISVEDCVAEGMPSYTRAKGVLSATPPDHRWWYMEWWDELHRKREHKWEANPWVWVYGLEEAGAST